MSTRVLIVDDDAGFRRVASSALAAGGYVTVAEAATVGQARAALGEIKADAVLLDINLPDGSGVALAEELRRTHPELRVLLTSSSDSGPRGPTPFLAKTELVGSDLAPYLGASSDGRGT
jgi:DNA-binding NtrC family response regulator